MIQKHHHLLGLIKAHSTWNEAKWETDLWSDESTWMPLSPQWRREGPSSSFTVFSSKHCMVWGCVSAYEIGIYISKRHINSGKYIQVLKPHMFLSFRPYFIVASIPTACVAVEESRCWSCVPTVQTFHQLKIFGKSWNEKHNKEDPELLEKKSFVKRMWIRCWVYEIYKRLDSVCICILHSNPTFSGLGLYIIDLSAFLLLVCHRQQMLLLYLHSSWWSSMAKCFGLVFVPV